MDLDPDTIERIWLALQRPAPSNRPRAGTMVARIATTGWASEVDIEDLLLTLDRRTDPPAIIDIKAFATALELPFRWAFPRPRHRNDDSSGFRMLSIVDLAALCVWLERLGFQLNVTDLCAEAMKHVTSASHVSGEDISVLFYEANRHRLGSVTLSPPHREWRGMNKTRFKTAAGYRLEYASDDDGKALWLTAHAPKFRKRPEQVAVTCPDCGMLYVKGLRGDEQAHRSFHRKRFAIIEPKPHKRFVEALDKDLDAAWIDARSPKWKRKEVYDRALEFKRELGFDFPQWSIDASYDFEAVGFLFSDERGRIVGACSFRPQGEHQERPWKLDWIWLCPDARRQGHLGQQWERFRQRFGVFDIEPPVSEAMQAFLRKRGCAHLIR